MKCIYKCTGILTILIYLSSLNIIFSYNKLSAQNRYTTSLIKQKYKKTSLYSSRLGYLDSIISSNKLNKLNVKLSSIINPVIFGGLLSGGLHAITGPDHLAAILPTSIGQNFFSGLRVGAVWGLGHGVTATILGIFAFFLKGKMTSKFKFLERLSSLTDSAVGISLISIGIIGIKESLSAENVEELFDENTKDTIDGSMYYTPPKDEKKPLTSIFVNGIFHGLSLDGAPSIAPALAMASWKSALSYLFSYCFGTMVAMSLFAGVIGEGSLRLGKVVNKPNLTTNLSLGSSIIALLIGIYYLLF